MSRQPDNAYRATDPAAVKASLDAYDEKRAAFFDAVKEFGNRLGHEVAIVGNNERMFASYLLGNWRRDGKYEKPAGLPSDKIADIPDGWHFYAKDREVRPYRGGRDKASKAACTAVDQLNKQSPGGLGLWLRSEFGIQPDVPFIRFGFEPVGDTYFVLTASGGLFASSWDGNEHFEKVPMSTYWLAKEQDAEREAAS